DFNLSRVLATLARHGVTQADAPAAMKVNVSKRGGSSDLLFGDPDGILCQLQDAAYCGGSGALGTRCDAVQPSPKKGLLAVKDYSHITVFSTDARRSNAFYQDLFAFSIRSYQGPTSPTLAVGPAVEFLMFTGGGAPARGGAAAAPRPAS